MDNIMDGMLEPYLFETNGLLDSLDEMLVRDEKEGDFSQDDVNEIFRIMHTIKGSSAMMQFDGISKAAHRVEDLFFFIRDKGIEYLDAEDKKELFDLMFKSEDFLRSEVSKVENGEPLSDNVDDFTNMVSRFLDKISADEAKNEAAAAGAAAAGGASTTDAAATTGCTSPTGAAATGTPAAGKPSSGAASAQSVPDDQSAAVFIHVFLEEGLQMENLRAFMIVTALKDSGIAFRYYPADMDTNPDTAKDIIANGFWFAFDSLDLCNSAESVIKEQPHVRSIEIVDQPSQMGESTDSAASAGVLTGTPAGSSAQGSAKAPSPDAAAASDASAGSPSPASAAVQKAPSPAPAKAPAAPHAAQPAAIHSNAPVRQSLISVNLEKLDDLMNLVGEIVITESMVTSSPVLKQLSAESYESFNKSARQLRKLTNDLQDIAMSLRMVPISGVFQKMNRIVRDMKNKLNKDVRLTIIGEETEVDKTIVDSIQDPIMHIVRNSMDHGIEATAAERVAAGKDPQGEIVLSAQHTSSEVVISVKDDGYGMDPQVLLDKAESKGILTKPKSEYSAKEALNLILLPGFSTNKNVTEYSGRGVGMDVVKKNVESVGGTVLIESEVGRGTTITLKIPLTLAIVDGMKVTVGDSIFTIPIANIRQSFKISSSDIIVDENGGEMIERMDRYYPMVRLSDYFHIPCRIKNVEDGILIWVEANDKSCCLLADELIGEQQVVVKPLPTYFNNFSLKNSGISGCTILGDGNISIILDVLGVYNTAIEHI